MNAQFPKKIFSTVAIVGTILLGQSPNLFAYHNPSENTENRPIKLQEHKKAFKIGVCVGQTLADQGIMLPHAQSGRMPQLDEATRNAIRKAVKQCIEELRSSEPGSGGNPEEEMSDIL